MLMHQPACTKCNKRRDQPDDQPKATLPPKEPTKGELDERLAAAEKKLREFEVPTLHAPMQTTHAVELIQKHTHKLNATDRARTGAAVRHVQDHVDLALLGYPAAKPGSGAGENGRLQDANGNGRPQITDFL